MSTSPTPGPLPLLRGTLDVLVLRALADAPEPLHGYGVVSHLEAVSGGALRVEDGALYQALHRMAERGWVESDWGHAESGKRARFYTLTDEGRTQLRTESVTWVAYAEALLRVLNPVRT